METDLEPDRGARGAWARRALAPLLAQPARWAWPAAVVLTIVAPRGPDTALAAVGRHYLPALLLVLLGCFPSRGRSPAREGEPEPTFLSRRVLVGLTFAILAAATVVRLWRLPEWPPEGIGFEETQLAARANIGGDPIRNLARVYSDVKEHALTVYAVSASFALFGTGFLQMRLPFIVGGLVSPFLFYAVCRKLVSWEVALFALSLFAVSWWQIAASRPADEIFFPLWAELAVLWLLLHFEDTAHAWAGACLALLSGLLLYEYAAYRLVAPLVLGSLLAAALRFARGIRRAPAPWPERRRRLIAAARPYVPGATAMVLVWMIVAHLQLLRDLRLGMGSWFLEGVARHASGGFLARLGAPAELAGFVSDRLADLFRSAYAPGFGGECRFLRVGAHPAFDLATALAIASGFALVALTVRRRWHALVLIWSALVIAGGVLLPGNLNLHRYYTALPIFYLMVALAAEVLWRWWRAPAARIALLGLFTATAAYAAVDNLGYVFWQLVPDQELRSHWIWPRTEIIRWIRARDPGDEICVVADDDLGILGANPLQPDWSFLVRGWAVRVAPTAEECLPEPMSGHGTRYVVFALAESPTDLVALLRRSNPAARELAPIEVPHHRFVARTFSVDGSGE